MSFFKLSLLSSGAAFLAGSGLTFLMCSNSDPLGLNSGKSSPSVQQSQRSQRFSANQGSVPHTSYSFSQEEFANLVEVHKRDLLSDYFQEWVESEPLAAFNAFRNLESRDDQLLIAGALFRTWGKQDPFAALKASKSLNDGELEDLATAMLTGGWAEVDPRAAANHIMDLPLGNYRMQRITIIADEWAVQDPRAALSWVTDLPSAKDHDQALQAVFAKWALKDAPSALAELKNYEEGPWRDTSLYGLVSNWATVNPDEASIFLLESDSHSFSNLDPQLWTEVTNQFLEKDPEAAISWLNKIKNPVLQAQTMMSVMSSLIRFDPKRTRELILSMPDREEGMMQQYANEWAATDIEAAVEWAKTTQEEHQVDAMRGVGLRLSERSPEEAVKFVAQLEGDTRDVFLVQLLSEWGAYEPYKAYDFAAEEVSLEYLPAAAFQIANSLGNSEPSLAAEWVVQFESGDLKNELMAGVFENWVNASPSKAMNFAASIDDASAKLSAVEACFDHARRYNPQVAFDWLASENMLQIDSRALKNSYLTWAAKQPEEARAWAMRQQGKLPFKVGE